MYYHADCGHVFEEDTESPLISDHEWRHYTQMYLGGCPICDSRYPYLKPLDNSVISETEKLIYRFLQAGHTVHIPPFSSPTKSIRLENVEKEELGLEVQHKIVDTIDQYDEDVLVRIKQ